jgi:glucokinase
VFGRVSAEHILSGPGVVNIYRFTHDVIDRPQGGRPADELGSQDATIPPTCEAVGQVTDIAELPRRITEAALAGACERCVETLNLFISAYGAEAGNVGLRVVATAGVYIGGGIAPKILPALRSGRFMEAFLAKAPLDHLVAKMPVAVILNKQSGLLGAAVHANRNRRPRS